MSLFFFFFSSRRRHTRCSRDWSSDVCSSDLFQWTAPIALSPHDPNILYHGGERGFMSKDAGKSWTALSGDLTRGGKSKQRSSRGPPTQGKTSRQEFQTGVAILQWAPAKGVIWGRP